jgi:hypothetical protein
MPLNKSGRRTKADQEFDNFGKETPQERVYSSQELERFHSLIQKFYESKTIQNPNAEDFGQTYLVLNHQKLHVAYGACRPVEHGVRHDGTPMVYYFYNSERYNQFNNLWKQYEEHRRKLDWIADKENERLQEMAQVAF